MIIQYGPIRSWPGALRANSERIRAPFKTSHSETLRTLDRELRMIRAEAPVVAIATEHFNRNGEPYADATPDHPGVILSFVKPIWDAKAKDRRRVPLRFAADRFSNWTANLRAIAIGLEDLRRIDRYGITSGSEQYLGFKALPPPGPDHEDILTLEDAARFVTAGMVNHVASDVVSSSELYREAYRSAALRLHPDAGAANGDGWSKLQAAKSLLDAHHGVRTAP